ncbi:MAG: ribosomal L7Ae/L30e/S12e/Gadd45 family protein [Corallococcus sp.]|nr:ribosomal L7Ae/L30e/S12e/Gadd45 family protein [Corallococcus sp.]MCM1360112.1 ribosomal L7Ae/L30e/S12e/Gadd45 family protein [Corallococcus sp.]MCM1395669.1 ribosomal L7Ae/L30e/S12e/Gadd45 family protein [Corallococcus sp.]
MDYKKDKVVVGKKQILRCLAENDVKTICIATDADRDYTKSIEQVAKLHNVKVERKGTMEQIAAQFGIDVPSGAVAELKD